jgi:CubicO group peptidase (beta-lactamase class C family)
MASLLELFLRRGKVGSARLLDATSITRMERPGTTLAAQHGLTYGYGLGLDQSLHDGFIWYGHGGDGDGYLSRFDYNREADAGYFLAINAFNNEALRVMRERVREYLTRDLATAQSTREYIDVELLRPLTGTYVAITRRFPWQTQAQLDADRVQLVLEGGALFTRTTNGRRLLIPVDAHRFRRESQPIATVAIIEHDDDFYLQADFGNYRLLESQ